MSVQPAAAPQEAAPDLRAILADPTASMVQLMGAVAALETEWTGPVASVAVSGGATVDLLGLYLRRHGLLSGVRISFTSGDFDNPLGDIARFAAAGVEHIVLAPFLDTLAPAFEATIPTLSAAEFDAREAELRGRWRLALEKAKGFRTVILCGLHRITAPLAGGDAVDEAVARFNRALRDEAAKFGNVRWLDLGGMVGLLGRKAALDLRFYLRNTAPYTPALLDEWARQAAAVSRGFGTRYHKALVLDCDNTLWGGVIGEDLAAGIKLDPHSYPGRVFHRAQSEFLALQRQGVLLCLCSKNDAAEVDAVLAGHGDMVLRDADIILKKVNWDDKVSNLRAIAAELNIGLDAIAFVDDSAFECEAVRSQLPQVTVFQVPANPPEYMTTLAAIRDLFLAGATSTEGAGKTEQYRQRAEALAEAETFATQEDYLASLNLTVTLTRDDAARTARIAELSQKSNQFNLTTLRYTPAEIEALVADPDAALYAIDVADRFGAAGLTGVVAVRYRGEVAVIESLFMSCRVLGRGVEFSIWPAIVADAAARGCTRIEAIYRPSAKNSQTADFYDRLGLAHVGGEDGARSYQSPIADFAPPPAPWIEVTHAG